MTEMARQSDRAFGLMFAVVFAVVATVGFFVFDAVWRWAVAAAATFLAVALAAPWLLLPLNRLWAAFAMRLGHASNFVLLGAFYFVVVLPAGLIMRLFTDPMARRIDSAAASYWTAVGRKADAETYRDQF